MSQGDTQSRPLALPPALQAAFGRAVREAINQDPLWLGRRVALLSVLTAVGLALAAGVAMGQRQAATTPSNATTTPTPVIER